MDSPLIRGHRMDVKPTQQDRHAKHVAVHGARGGPRKGGAGSKGAWGVVGSEIRYQDDAGFLDKDDPNYDSENEDVGRIVFEDTFTEEPSPKSQSRFLRGLQALTAFKQFVRQASSAVLVEKDDEQFVRDIKEYGAAPHMLFHVPRILMSEALDRSKEDRKFVSKLIVECVLQEAFSQHDVVRGFDQLFSRINDLSLDVPNAFEVAVQFARQSTDDDLLSSAQLDELIAVGDLTLHPEKFRSFKLAAHGVFEDYFSSGDIVGAVTSVQELKQPMLGYEIVKQAVSLALDKGQRERELVSVFLAYQTENGARVISSEQVAKGFEVLLHRVEDLYQDVPDILHLLSSFIARAVVDEVIPPAFIDSANLSVNDMGVEVLDRARKVMESPHAAEHMIRVWGAKGRSVRELKDAIKGCILDYFASGVVDEAVETLQQLEEPPFGHEIVYRLFQMAVDRAEHEFHLTETLLDELIKYPDVVSPKQLGIGLKRIETSLEGTTLDAPHAPETFAKLKAKYGSIAEYPE